MTSHGHCGLHSVPNAATPEDEPSLPVAGLLADLNDIGSGLLFTAPNTEREKNHTCNHEREIDHTARRSAYGFDCLVRTNPKPHRVFKREQHIENRDQRPVTDRDKQVDQANYQLRQPPEREYPDHRISRIVRIGIEWNRGDALRATIMAKQMVLTAPKGQGCQGIEGIECDLVAGKLVV